MTENLDSVKERMDKILSRALDEVTIHEGHHGCGMDLWSNAMTYRIAAYYNLKRITPPPLPVGFPVYKGGNQ